MDNTVVTKKMFLWNLTGCIINAATSFLMLASVTRAAGLTDAGYFSIALATAQLLLSFGKYGVRAYQATDVRNDVKSISYIMHRGIVVAGMMFFSLAFILISGYSAYKGEIVFCVCGLKALDAIEDVFHGELQKKGRLDIAGKLLTGRNILTLALFEVLIFSTNDLLLSCFLTFVISLVICLGLNIKVTNTQHSTCLRHSVNKETTKISDGYIKEIRHVFVDCFPLFISSFLSILIYNTPKYAIDIFDSSEKQAIYSMLFMPAFVINLISEFVFKPLLTPLAVHWESRNWPAARAIIRKLFLAVLAIALITLFGGFLLGIPLLGWFYGVQLADYKRELMLLLIGGGFSAAVYLSYNLLTMMRAQKTILLGYLIGSVLMVPTAWGLVSRWSLLGASCAYVFIEAAVAVYFYGCIKRRLGRADT